MTKKLLKIIIIITMFIGINVAAFSEVSYQDNFIENVAKIKPKCVFVIATFIKDAAGRLSGERNQYGSGFIFDTPQANGLRLITNKHILKNEQTGQIADKIKVRVNVTNAKKYVFVNCELNGMHPEYDLAILTLKQPETEDKDIPTMNIEIRGDKIEYINIENQNVWEGDFIKEDIEVKEGMEIFYTGYPLGLGGMEYKSFPVTRRGIVAQVMPDNKYFVIDALSSHGNSGSPVLGITKEGWKIIGILKGIYCDYNAEGKPDNAGLSVVISGTVIVDYINQLIRDKKIFSLWS